MRAYLLEKFYEMSTLPYQLFFKAKTDAWNLSIWDLIHYPDGTLAHDLGVFLQKNGFTPQDKLESHDVFHVLTGSGVEVPEEISMQYFLYGNGKRSAYLYMVMAVGTLLYPDKLKRFRFALNQGENSLPFHDLNFQDLLQQPTAELKHKYNIQPNVFKPIDITASEYVMLRYKSAMSK